MYHRKLLADNAQRNQDFANFVGASMQEMAQRQPHVTYNVFTGGQPPPPPPSPTAIQVQPTQQLEALQRTLEREREQSKLKLHEVTASTQQSVNQQMMEMQGRVMRAEEIARSAAAASTDEIRASRGTRAWNEALAEELRAAKREVQNMQEEKRAFFEQQMANEVEKASRKAATTENTEKKKKEGHLCNRRSL